MRRGKIYLNDIYLRGDADGRRKWFYLCLCCRILALSGWHLKNFSLYDTGMGYSLTPAYHLLSTVIVMPEDTEELAGGQWQGNREHRLEIPTFHH